MALIAVVKLSRGVASDGANLYPDLLLLRQAFVRVLHPMLDSSTAAQHESVRVQELVIGTEYTVSVVCCNRERRVVVLWWYDKHAANGPSFVHHEKRLVSADGRGRGDPDRRYQHALAQDDRGPDGPGGTCQGQNGRLCAGRR